MAKIGTVTPINITTVRIEIDIERRKPSPALEGAKRLITRKPKPIVRVPIIHQAIATTRNMIPIESADKR